MGIKLEDIICLLIIIGFSCLLGCQFVENKYKMKKINSVSSDQMKYTCGVEGGCEMSINGTYDTREECEMKCGGRYN